MTDCPVCGIFTSDKPVQDPLLRVEPYIVQRTRKALVMASSSVKGFASQIRFVVEATGDDVESIEPVLGGIFAQTAKETDIGGDVALAIFAQLPSTWHFLKEQNGLLDLLIRAWLLTEDEQRELKYAQEMRTTKHPSPRNKAVAERFRELLNVHQKYLENRIAWGKDHLRFMLFREKLARFVAGAEAGCQSETLKLAAHAHIRASSPASVAAMYKTSASQ